MNRDSLYAIDCTIADRQHRPQQHRADAGPATRTAWSATAKIPQAAASEASALTTQTRVRVRQRGHRRSSRSSHGSSGKNARFECTSPFGSRTS